MLTHFDLAFKSELFMFDLQSVMFWGSIIELSMFMLGFILFCSVPGLMSLIWLHIFHIPRAVVGFLLLKRLPRSHDIIDQVHLPGEHYSLDQLTKSLKESVTKIFIDYTESCKCLLLTYCVFTLIAICFDFVQFLV